MHYCDHNATSPLRPESLAAMTHALGVCGNPSSVHANGRAARAIVDDARDKIAALIGATSEQVIFTSGATEAASLALRGAIEGALDAQESDGRPRIARLFVSAIEHACVQATARRMAEHLPWLGLTTLPVTAGGVVDTEVLRVALREGEGRALVAVMAANNETGVIQPLAEVSRLCREAGALLLVDAVPAAGKIALDFSLCDYMVLSAHKMGGPQGAGALVVADGAPLRPQLLGGGQQRGLRAGTENLAGIAGFGAAAHTLRDADGERARLAHLTERFETALKKAVPDAAIFGADAARLCSTSNFAIPGVASQTALIALDLDGVRMSAGATCSSGRIEPSHVLAAMGIAPELSEAALRASFGWNSTIEDVQAAVESLVKLTERARRSPTTDRAA
jgi:cysteine desulfurase